MELPVEDTLRVELDRLDDEDELLRLDDEELLRDLPPPARAGIVSTLSSITITIRNRDFGKKLLCT